MSASMVNLTSVFVSASVLQIEVDKELKRLCGCWYLLSTADERRTDVGSPESTMTIGAKGGVTLKANEAVTAKGRFTLGRSGKLKTINLKLDDGRMLLGVYELKGAELTVCFAEAGKPRPTGVTPKGRQWAERWKLESL